MAKKRKAAKKVGKKKTAKKAYLQLSGLDWKRSSSLIEGSVVELSEGHSVEMVQ